MSCRHIRVSDVSCETWNRPSDLWKGSTACLSCVLLLRYVGNDNNGGRFVQNNHLCVCLIESIYTSAALLLLTENINYEVGLAVSDVMFITIKKFS